jgi:acyl dehydratase
MSSLGTPDLTLEMASLPESIGRQVGPTEWVEITQAEVDDFARLTGDHNFLHVEPERAATTPFGGTIAHGFLSLSLLAPVTQLLAVSDAATSINYGLDKVRFPAPLPVGKRWRGVAEVTEVGEIKGGYQARMLATLQVEGSERPAAVAECLIRFYA